MADWVGVDVSDRTCVIDGCTESPVKKPGPGRWPHHCPSHLGQKPVSTRPPKPTCEVCSQTYTRTYKEQRTCSRICGVALRRQVTGTLPAQCPSTAIVWSACLACGKHTAWRRPRSYCRALDCQREKNRRGMNAAYERYKDRLISAAHKRRVLLESRWVEDVQLSVLIERDRGICRLCHKPVKLGKRGPLMPSIDHVVPLIDDGEHSYANTQLAHYRCNLSKGRRGGGEQLAIL